MAGVTERDETQAEAMVVHGTMSAEEGKAEACKRMLERVANTDAYFGQQQRDSPDLTFTEKYSIAQEVFKKNPVTFLSRYNKHLVLEDFQCFDDWKQTYEVNFYLKEISERLNVTKNKARVRNRRYTAMEELLHKGEYFSDKEMKWRDPYLYEQMVGQYLTEEERQQDIDKSDLHFSTILLDHISQQQENNLYQKQHDYEEGQKEESEDEEECDEETEINTGERSDHNKTEEISCGQKQLLREEFVHIMQERFLSGQDKDFDYGSVDTNDEYDSLKMRERDEEDRYFDEEDSDTMDSKSLEDG